jgi:hypothetical protein
VAWLTAVLSIIASLVWLTWKGGVRNAVVSGDAAAVYWPAARALLNDDGARSFAHLAHGVARMPAYPVALAAALKLTEDVGSASRIIGQLAAAIALSGLVLLMARSGVKPLFVALSVIVTATNPTFARSVFEPLPDLCFVAVVLATAAWGTTSLRSSTTGRSAFVLGALIGLATLFRINALAFLPVGALALVTTRHRLCRSLILMMLGVLASLLPILFLSMNLRTYGLVYPSLNYFGSGNRPDLLRSISIGINNVSLVFQLVSGWTGIVGLLGLVLGLLTQQYRRISYAILSIASSLVLSLMPIHFEARYYLLLVPSLTIGMFIGLDQVMRERFGLSRFRSIAGIAATLYIVHLQLASVDREAVRSKRESLAVQEICDIVAREAVGNKLVVATSPGTYTYSSFRFCEGLYLVPTVFGGDSRTTFGVDLWIDTKNRTLTDGLEVIARNSYWILAKSNPEDDGLIPAEGPSVINWNDVWRMNFPRPRTELCQARSIRLEPGSYAILADVRSTGELIPSVSLFKNGTLFWTKWQPTGLGRVLKAFQLKEQGDIEIRVCPNDPYSVGSISIPRLSIIQTD